LAEDLLQMLRTASKKAVSTTEQSLAPVVGLTEGELKALAESVVAPERQQQIQTLLEMNHTQELSVKAEVDRIALLKARALYTLKLKQDNAFNFYCGMAAMKIDSLAE